MLARKYRLPFGVKLDKALFFSTYLFDVRVKQNNLLHNRYAVVVSKKTDKRATVRNRIRRLIHTVLAEVLGKTKNGFCETADFLFIVKKEAVGKKKEDFYNVILNLFQDL